MHSESCMHQPLFHTSAQALTFHANNLQTCALDGDGVWASVCFPLGLLQVISGWEGDIIVCLLCVHNCHRHHWNRHTWMSAFTAKPLHTLTDYSTHDMAATVASILDCLPSTHIPTKVCLQQIALAPKSTQPKIVARNVLRSKDSQDNINHITY